MIWAFWISFTILVYVHVGYWAVLHVIPGCRRAPAPGPLPAVTLIVPAHNEEKCLAAKLRNTLEEIDYPRELLEIIVASDASTDGTVGIARSYEARGVRVLAFDQRRGKTSALNDAIAAATHDVLCLCDANVMFAPQALRFLVAHLNDPAVGAVTGDVQIASQDANFGSGESLYYRIERNIQTHESRTGTTICVDGGMYVVRRELYQRLAGDTIIDDFVISMNVIRQNKSVVYEPRATAREDAVIKARHEFSRRVRVSAGAAQAIKRGDFPAIWRVATFWKFASHKLLRWTSPAWLVILLVSNFVLAGRGIVYEMLLGGQAFFYFLALLGGVSVRFRATRFGGVPFYYVMSHIAMVVGTVKGLLNLQHAAWNRSERSTVEIPLRSTRGAI